MKEWWQQLAPRERRVLLLGGGALAVILYIFAFRMPAAATVAELRTQVSQERELVAWMEDSRREIRRLRGRAEPSTASESPHQSLYSLADASARDAGLDSALSRVEPAGGNGARVNFEDIAFDELVRWLAQLRREHGIIADQVTVRRGSDQGRVNVQLVLEPA